MGRSRDRPDESPAGFVFPAFRLAFEPALELDRRRSRPLETDANHGRLVARQFDRNVRGSERRLDWRAVHERLPAVALELAISRGSSKRYIDDDRPSRSEAIEPESAIHGCSERTPRRLGR